MQDRHIGDVRVTHVERATRLLAVAGAFALVACAEEPPPPHGDHFFFPAMVFFDSGSSTFKGDGRSLRTTVADYRMPNHSKEMFVSIIGHADSTGDEQQNLRLSVLRAKTVKDFLETAGLPAKDLVAMGCGSTRPMAKRPPNTDEAQNRRVEVKVILGGSPVEREGCKMVE